jgi:hypothetical protein
MFLSQNILNSETSQICAERRQLTYRLLFEFYCHWVYMDEGLLQKDKCTVKVSAENGSVHLPNWKMYTSFFMAVPLSL